MMNRTAYNVPEVLMLFCAGALLVACKPQDVPAPRTSETAAVRASLENFKGQPTEENLKRVEADLAKLQAEIRELDLRVSQTSGAEKSESQAKLDDLRGRDAGYRAEFAAARVSATVNKAGNAAEKAVEKAGDAARETARAVENTFETKEKP